MYFCHNVAPATGYTGVGYSTGPVGTLETTTSWFVCMNDYGDPNGEGSPNPTRWIWTEMDYPHGVWGWIPDKQITSDTDPIPDCFD